MAYIVDFAITENAAGGAASVAANVPPHDPNDILLVIAAINGSSTVSMTNTGGTWTQIGTTQTANTGITQAAFWMRADVTDAEVATVNFGTPDDYTIKVITLRDVDTTTAVDVSVTSNSGAATASEFTSPSVVTTTADCLIIYAHALDGVTPQVHPDPGIHHLISSDSTGTTAQTSAHSSVGWYIQRAAGTTPTPSWTANAAAVRCNLTVAFRNVSGGRIPAYIDDVISPGAKIHSGTHTGTLNNTVVTTTFTSTANINGKTVAASTATLGADFGINPYSNALGRTAAITAVNSLGGYQITLTGNRNWSTGLIMGALIALSPKSGTFGLGSIAQGGFVVRMGSSATAWNAYQVAAKDTSVTTENRYVFAIEPGYTSTAYGATQGTAVTTTAMSHIQFLMNCPSFAANVYLSDLTQVFTQVVAGGTATFPVDTEGLAQVGRSFRLPVIQKVGSSVLSFAPLQIGGGDAVNFQINAAAIQFPRRYNVDVKEIAYHASDNKIGISFAGKSGDVIKLTNSVVTSPTPYYFEINASATSAATWDFAGLTIVNGTVTLRNVTTFTTLTFSGCPSITVSGVTLTNSSITGVPTTSGSLVVSGTSSISGCQINTTGVSAGNALVVTATPQVFSSTTFTGSGTSGHAIQITSPGTYNLSGLVFTGYGGTGGTNSTPNSGSTSAAIYNNSGGAVIINVSGGGSVPSIRNGAGATTTVNAAASLTLTGLVADSEVRAYVGTNPATATELSGTESSATSFNFSHSVAGQAGYIQVFHVDYQPIIINLTYSGTDSSIPVQQTTDRQYARGSIFTPG